MMKLWRLVVILLCVSVLAVVALMVRHARVDQEERIGVVLPLTGDLAVYGQKMKKGIDLAADQANSNVGSHEQHIRLIYEDDQGNPNSSIAAVQKLISLSRVSVIIGGATSATALPAIPIIDRSHSVFFSPAATSPKLTGASRYFFRNWPSDIYDGRAMGDFAAKTLQLKRIAVLYVDNEWGVAISKVFTNTFESDGGTVVATETYEPNAIDFRTQLTKIASQSPEAIYIPGYLKELILILRQKHELGVEARVLSAYGFYDPQILEQAPVAAEGAIFTAPAYDPDTPDPLVRGFTQAFRAAYREKPDIWAAQAYDAARIIIAALRNGANTGEEIRRAIAKVRNFDGVSGRTSFDERGDVEKPLRFMTVRNGRFSDYEEKKL